MKKILAIAIASAFAAPAFAATSNVDVYGKLHVSVSAYDDQVASADDLQVSSNASRIGFKGSEDLGGGLSAIWQLEQGVNLDEKSGSFASRNSFVGLKGGFGTVLAGNHDTPLKIVGRKVDLFGDTIADSRNVNGVGSDTRSENTVAYISPNFSGFAFAAAYANDIGSGSNSGDKADDAAWNVNGTYTNGPLFVGVGYGDGDHHDNAGLGKQWRAAAGLTMGDIKLVGQYDSLDSNSGNDFDAWMVGASYKMGAMTFKANYMDGDYDTSADPKQWTVGMDYALSKRTSAYVLYADGENVTLGAGGGSSDRLSSGVAGGDISAFSVGMIHNF